MIVAGSKYIQLDSRFNGVLEVVWTVGTAWRTSEASFRQPITFDLNHGDSSTDQTASASNELVAMCLRIYSAFVFFWFLPIFAKLVVDPPMKWMAFLHFGPCVSYLVAISDTAAALEPEIYVFLLLPFLCVLAIEYNTRLSFVNVLLIDRLEQQVVCLERTVRDVQEDSLVLEEYRSLFEEV